MASVAFTPLIPALGAAPTVWMIISSILIDLDHLELIIRERAFTIERMRFLIEHIYDREINGKPNRAYVDILYPFHVIEFNALILFLSIQFHWLLYVFIGFAFHILCDVIHDWRLGLPIARWLFFFNWANYKHTTGKHLAGIKKTTGAEVGYLN